MKIFYDRKVDALYIELRPSQPGTAQTKEITEDIIADYGPDGKVTGIEILDASQTLGDYLYQLSFEIPTPVTSH